MLETGFRYAAAQEATLGGASWQYPCSTCIPWHIGLLTLVPRTCAVRQELEAWGCQQPTLPLLLEKPGRTQDEAPRRWHGHSVLRQVEVEDKEGRIAQETIRFVVVHSSQLAHQQTQTYASGQAKEAEAVTDHVQRVQARWFACAADAAAAIAEYGLHTRSVQIRTLTYYTHNLGNGRRIAAVSLLVTLAEPLKRPKTAGLIKDACSLCNTSDIF